MEEMTHLDRLEAEAIYIMREVVAECDKPVMLYSIGKDSSVMLHLALKAFYPEKPPFPFFHIDTTWKFHEMITFRDRIAEEKGIEMLDAPVSGGEPKAIDGTLSFMVGGKQEIFDKYKPILEAMGTSVVRCGDVGAGNTTKLANQIIVACNIQAVAEALVLAQKAGVDPQLVFEAIRGGLAGSTVMNSKAPMMIAGIDKPGFKVDLHIKDLNNALDCAHTVGAPVPMTAAVQEILQWLHSHDGGQKDHSAIAQYYEELTDIKIGR